MNRISPGRRPLLRSVCALLCSIAASCASLQPLEPAKTYYVNPVLDQDFPDPTVLRAPDGWYYAYATQTTLSDRTVNIQIARSRDLVRWEHMGDALPQKPNWASGTQNFWAPDVIYDAEGARYVMYYSAQPDARKELCLAVATSQAPMGPYVDSGEPLACGAEHIDPMAFDDPNSGRRLLYWGFRSIRVQELAPDRLRFAQGSEPVQVMLPGQERDYSLIVEGAWVTYRDGKYFLFYSGDFCCGAQPSYAVMVARAESPLGPFRRLGEEDGSGRSVILERRNFWRAPGHNSVISDLAGSHWMLYHAVDPRQPMFEDRVHGRVARRVLLIDRIEYRDGWPRIAGDAPSIGAQAAPAMSEGSAR